MNLNPKSVELQFYNSLIKDKVNHFNQTLNSKIDQLKAKYTTKG